MITRIFVMRSLLSRAIWSVHFFTVNFAAIASVGASNLASFNLNKASGPRRKFDMSSETAGQTNALAETRE